jgi:hypothetical protein
MSSARMNSEQEMLHHVNRWRKARGYESFDGETPAIKRDLRSSILVSEKLIRCTADRCSSPGICVLELQPFCLHHFITCCFERLRLCSVSWCVNPRSANTESYDAFIRECIMKTARLLQDDIEVDPVRRSHLLDVFLWASELAVKRNVSAPEADEPLSFGAGA